MSRRATETQKRESSNQMSPTITASGSSQPEERRYIVKTIVLTDCALAGLLYVLYYVFPFPIPRLPTAADRLVFTLRLQSFSVLTLLGRVVHVANTRFYTTAVDPIDGKGEYHVAVGVRYLSNTMEQLFMSVLGQLVLASYLEESQMKLVPVLVLFFVFGRAAFFFGYRMSYLKRAVGFTTTFTPTAIVWAVNMYLLISDILLS